MSDAAAVRDFHARAAGRQVGEVEMGGYQDHRVNEPAGQADGGQP